MYADIGPLSIKRQPCIATLNQEDQRVEYSLVKFKAHKKAPPPPPPEKIDNGQDDQLSAGNIKHRMF